MKNTKTVSVAVPVTIETKITKAGDEVVATGTAMFAGVLLAEVRESHFIDTEREVIALLKAMINGVVA